jgi:c-di-GMP-binding flagellar brake protein YcgR
MKDKRSEIRWQVGSDAKIKLEGSKAFISCQIKDINFKGIQIALRMKPPKERTLKLTIALSDEFVLNVEAWVVWQKHIDGFYLHGICFSKISEQDKGKIYKFIYKNFPQEATKRWARERGIDKGGEVMQDRRIFARVPVSLPLRFIDLRMNQEGQAQTVDVSAKGIGVVSNRELSPRTPLEMWLNIPDHHEPLYMRAEVVWSNRLEPNKYRLGIELEKAELMGLSRLFRA